MTVQIKEMLGTVWVEDKPFDLSRGGGGGEDHSEHLHLAPDLCLTFKATVEDVSDTMFVLAGYRWHLKKRNPLKVRMCTVGGITFLCVNFVPFEAPMSRQ